MMPRMDRADALLIQRMQRAEALFQERMQLQTEGWKLHCESYDESTTLEKILEDWRKMWPLTPWGVRYRQLLNEERAIWKRR